MSTQDDPWAFLGAPQPTLADFKPRTLAWLIQRYIEEMEAIRRPLGSSQRYLLRAVQRRPIGQKIAAKLTKTDFIDYAKARRKTVCPATVLQDISSIGVVLKYAASAWDDCEDVSAAPITAARPLLVKYGLMGKSAPRKRVPVGDEMDRLLTFFSLQDAKARTKIKMVPVVLFGLASTRRRGEVCRMQHGDIDWQKRTYMIRDMKHPTRKLGNHKVFPLTDELAQIIKAQPRLTDDPTERVFPYNPRSVTCRYVEAKKRLGIVNLRLHDNRRAAITRWLAILENPHKVKQISGHETTLILERVYDATDPALLHADLANVEMPKLPAPHAT